MKTLGAILLTISLISIVLLVIVGVYSSYQWNKNIESYWSLADKTSTIEAKSQYIDKFVDALENAKLSEYDAIILKTPDNKTEKNINALKTLQTRLQEIKTMDIQSFAYQQAIQQITAQEQGEADAMISAIEGSWYLANYPLLWNWILLIAICVVCLMGAVGILLLSV
jgi:hypothetical protein